MERLFDTVVAQAREAEASGFDTVLVMDHFYQLPGIGPAENAMLECYTTLAALASATSTVRLSALVTGNTYRNPALLAKTVTTLDVVSGGRAILGLGAGWFEKEHHEYGYEFGTFSQRFERLEEALGDHRADAAGRDPDVLGRLVPRRERAEQPTLAPDDPDHAGGGGERKTFRLAARFADHMNVICDREDIPRKVAALRQRCEEAGRDPATLADELPCLGHADRVRDAAGRSWTWYRRSDSAGSSSVLPNMSPRACSEDVLDQGIDGLIVNMVLNGHEPGVVALAGQTLLPLVS